MLGQIANKLMMVNVW